jgi:hypothetical protein
MKYWLNAGSRDTQSISRGKQILEVLLKLKSIRLRLRLRFMVCQSSYLTQQRHKSLTLSMINASIAEVSTSGRGEPHERLSRQPRDISTAQSSDSWEPTYLHVE